MMHVDQTKIFFESDKFLVLGREGELVTIEVTRNGNTFKTTVSKSEFSLHAQEHFEDIVLGTRLRRGSCKFSVIAPKRRR